MDLATPKMAKTELEDSILSPEFKVARRVFLAEKEHKLMYFTKLKEELKMGPNTINSAIDSLLDIGILKAMWKETEGGRWARVFVVSNEAKSTLEELDNFLRGKS